MKIGFLIRFVMVDIGCLAQVKRCEDLLGLVLIKNYCSDININLEKTTSYTTDIVNCQNSPAKILGYSVSLASFSYLLVLPASVCATAFLQNFWCFTSVTCASH